MSSEDIIKDMRERLNNQGAMVVNREDLTARERYDYANMPPGKVFYIGEAPILKEPKPSYIANTLRAMAEKLEDMAWKIENK